MRDYEVDVLCGAKNRNGTWNSEVRAVMIQGSVREDNDEGVANENVDDGHQAWTGKGGVALPWPAIRKAVCARLLLDIGSTRL